MSSNTYVPFEGREGPFNYVLPPQQSPSLPISGNGTPEGSVPGVPGQTFIDIVTNNLYLKISGTQNTGWKLIGQAVPPSGGGGGGGGGAANIFRTTVDPVGVIQCVGPGMCLGDDTLAGKVWIKSTAGTNSTDWVLLIA